MKMRFLSILFILRMLLTMLPVSAGAAGESPTASAPAAADTDRVVT